MEEAADATDELVRKREDISRLKEQVLDFFSIGNAIQLFKRAINSAFENVKELDKVMTETAVVTEFDIGDMWSQLPQYTKRANELGISVKSAYEAATLFYQQGLKTNEVVGVSTETLKMARIANIEAAEATDLMTAALRGFNMEVNQVNAQKVNDVYSNLAAITAADTEKLVSLCQKLPLLLNLLIWILILLRHYCHRLLKQLVKRQKLLVLAMKTIIARFTEVKKLFSEGQLSGIDADGEVLILTKLMLL